MTQRHPPTGAALLDQLRAALTRYVILPSTETVDAVTLWIAATHAQPAMAHAPRLVIRGPEKRCGKSRLLDIVEATCHDPFITVNSSSPAIYRSITADPPTILVDEADTIFGPKADGNEDLRGLLNAGHQRNRPAKRYDAARNQVESIPTFAMAALAGIGAMPDTIEDRAIIVRMRRRGPGEKAAPYRHRRDRTPLREHLAGALNQWLRADLTALEEAEPAMPVEDRAADTWEPLIIIADHAGGTWPDRARAAAVALTAEADDNGRPSAGLRLLTDCRTAFGDDTALPTAVLLERLKANPEGEWNEHGPAGLSPRKLGVMLSEYDIRSANIRFPTGQAKGYQRADFADAWARYCPALDPLPEGDVVPFGRGTRPNRPNLVSAGQRGTESMPGTG
ncbi:DUF3631 domain-containing protein [Nonomuraea turkmeniaca]|uniref:DUF3631 domain-containing protein n=1 Tax=Nonomuraea turkmeniaca TaxID=103838 RepID=A0A5S4F3T1_9ACTN|nr:DUF3631 domain-containing protein [Nonomuraea turkmeniaca]TMR10806.1 DUF3631 domain-containing protein [Nonomuraea turkmeniaca]